MENKDRKVKISNIIDNVLSNTTFQMKNNNFHKDNCAIFD